MRQQARTGVFVFTGTTAPIESFQKHGQLRRAQDDRSILDGRPNELSLLDTFLMEPEPDPSSYDFDPIGTFRAEDVNVAGKWAFMHRLLNDGGERVHAFAPSTGAVATTIRIPVGAESSKPRHGGENTVQRHLVYHRRNAHHRHSDHDLDATTRRPIHLGGRPRAAEHAASTEIGTKLVNAAAGRNSRRQP